MIAVPASFVNSFLEFINKRLAINFKRRMTDYFHQSYLKDRVFYQLCNLDCRVSNPDQRLTSDIEKWATSMSMIYPNFSKPLLDIIMFSRKLSELVGWAGPGLVLLWYFISGFIIKLVSPPFGKLTAIEQRLEGVYRASHTDLVHHAEEIAFYKGNEWEKSRINNSFSQLTRHSESIINKKLYMGVFDSMLVKYGAVMVGYAVVGLPVFGPGSEEYLRKIGSDSSAITRDYVRNSSLLINLAKAIGRIVISYKEIQQLAGYTSLVYEMKEVLDDLQNGKYIRPQVRRGELERPRSKADLNIIDKGRIVETANILQFDKVPIVSPNGDILVEEISFAIKPGMHTIITGPNGCGKSSLFRVLGGLWPLVAGTVYRPKVDRLFYIPQRPYLPPGTLRDQVVYPHNKAEMIRRGKTDEVLSFLNRDAFGLIEGGPPGVPRGEGGRLQRSQRLERRVLRRGEAAHRHGPPFLPPARVRHPGYDWDNIRRVHQRGER